MVKQSMKFKNFSEYINECTQSLSENAFDIGQPPSKHRTTVSLSSQFGDISVKKPTEFRIRTSWALSNNNDCTSEPQSKNGAKENFDTYSSYKGAFNHRTTVQSSRLYS